MPFAPSEAPASDPVGLLARLRAVRAVRFTAGGGAAAGWEGAGEGTVDVSDAPGGGIVFAERGTWQPTLGGPLGFSNAYRWTPAAAPDVAVRLEHLRFGPSRPVVLFDLIPDAGRWRSRAPHVCGADHYAATLMIAAGSVKMEWTITGPRKRERIWYTYI